MKLADQLTGAGVFVALAVSVISGVFTLSQSSSAEQEDRINAAIELSKKYIEDTDIDPDMYAAGQDQKKTLFNRLKYIIFLANEGRIDAHYLAKYVQCEMKRVVLWREEDKDNPSAFAGLAELKKFINSTKIIRVCS